MAEDKPVAVPLVEQLRSIPIDAKLRIDTPNALGCMDTCSIPVGRLCHEAADALGVMAAETQRPLPYDRAAVETLAERHSIKDPCGALHPFARAVLEAHGYGVNPCGGGGNG